MNKEMLASTQALIDYIGRSPTPFHAVANAVLELEKAGFTRLEEHESWAMQPGGKYYVMRNMSTVIAVDIPVAGADSFMGAASHTDSPCFRLKTNFELETGKLLRLNTETYGGTILSTWMDRPLSIAGRVVVRTDRGYSQKLVDFAEPVAIIPSVAIHLSRTLGEMKLNPATDMLPLAASAGEKGALARAVSDMAGGEVISSDLYVYSAQPGYIWGAAREFFSAPRIDNLQSAWATLRGFIDSENPASIKVYACFDNEETGSATRQGAASGLLHEVLAAAAAAVDGDLEQMIARSFMLSVDNGHARHPNHPELSDGANAPEVNGGVVIKHNSNQKYTTDAVSSAIAQELCRAADVPVQHFSNRSDIAGGGTLGSISSTRAALRTADVGAAQLAMHSAVETGGCADTYYMQQFAGVMYSSRLIMESADSFRLELA